MIMDGDVGTVRPTPSMVARLARPPAPVAKVGEIWWVPRHHQPARRMSRGKKDRYCLVVAVETTNSGSTVVHLIAGTTSPGSAKSAFVVTAGDANLSETTYFKYYFYASLPATSLNQDGRRKGSLSPSQVADLGVAIMASNLVAVKRLWP